MTVTERLLSIKLLNALMDNQKEADKYNISVSMKDNNPKSNDQNHTNTNLKEENV